MRNETAANTALLATYDRRQNEMLAAQRAGLASKQLRMPAQSYKRTPSVRGWIMLSGVLTVAMTGMLVLVNFIR